MYIYRCILEAEDFKRRY